MGLAVKSAVAAVIAPPAWSPADPRNGRRGSVLHLESVAGVALFGAAGALSRYGLGRALQSWSAEFPWGTLIVNVSGAVAIALVAALALRAGALAPFLRLDVMTGFIGAYTTFSTFTLETVLLAQSAPLRAGFYLVGSTAAGLGAVWLGGALGGALR